MRVKKYLALTLAAILATTMLTACPWDQEEDETDDASSVPVTSTDTSQDDDDHDSGDDDSQPTKPTLTVSATGGDITNQNLVPDGDTGTYKATFTTNPTKDNYVVSSVEATVTTAGETLSASWPDDTATRARTLSMRADTELKLTPDNDTNPTKFTLTGIPADATSCTIDVTFEDLGYVIEDGVYKVYDADGLLAWAQSKDVLITDCTLTADITLTDNWTPIGNDSNRYTGTFDGEGHTISGLQISSTGNNIGLFGYVNGDTVKKLNLEIANIFGKFSVGGIAGYNNEGTIQGCMVSGSVSGSDWVGGIVGRNAGTVKGCCFAGSSSSVTAHTSNAWVGGVVGCNYGTVEACCFAGDSVTASGTGAAAGGVVGYNGSGSITACYWQEGTGGPSKGVGNGGDVAIKVENGDWNGITDNAFTSRFTVDSTTGKPVPSVIANRNNTPEVSGLTQRVLDAARAVGL